jgi:hypothetical protein
VEFLTVAEAATVAVLVLEPEAEPETAAVWVLAELEAAGLAGGWAVETELEDGTVLGTAAELGRFTLMTVDEPLCVVATLDALLPELPLTEPLLPELPLAEPLLTAPLVVVPLLEVPLVPETPLAEPLIETPLPEPLVTRTGSSVLSVITTIPGP